MRKMLSTIFLLLTTSVLYSQDKNIDNLFYSSFDNIIGQRNTKLSYGFVFKEKYRKRFKDNHNFFLNDQFKKGNIHYRGELFYNIGLKYDLVEDLLILKISNNEQLISVIPEKKNVLYFLLDNLKFVHTKKLGFLEEVIETKNFSIFKKHKKNVKENKDEKFIYHTFKQITQHFILYKKNYYSIESKRDFIRIFPNQKKAINKFFKSNKFLLKNDYKNFIVKLINQLQS